MQSQQQTEQPANQTKEQQQWEQRQRVQLHEHSIRNWVPAQSDARTGSNSSLS